MTNYIKTGNTFNNFSTLQVNITKATKAIDKVHCFIITVVEILPKFKIAIKDNYKTNKYWSKLLPSLLEDTSGGTKFIIQDGLIYYIDAFNSRLQLYIPKAL